MLAASSVRNGTPTTPVPRPTSSDDPFDIPDEVITAIQPPSKPGFPVADAAAVAAANGKMSPASIPLVDSRESSFRFVSANQAGSPMASPRTSPRVGSAAAGATGSVARHGSMSSHPPESESMKSSAQLKRMASNAVSDARRRSTFRITFEEASTQTDHALASLDECLYIRDVHNRIRHFSNLLQLWMEDPEGFDFVSEWTGTSLDEECQREAQTAFADEEVTIAALQAEMAALLETQNVANEAKVDTLAAISDRQKLLFLRRVRRMQEIAVKEKGGRKVKFLEMNQRGIDDDYTENNLFVRADTLAESCISHLGKVFVFLRACMSGGRLGSADGIFANVFPGGQKDRTLLGLGHLPGEIDEVLLPRDLDELKQMVNFHELPALMRLKYNSDWHFDTDTLTQMKLIFLERYCQVDLDKVVNGMGKMKECQTELVDVVSMGERKRRDQKMQELAARVEALEQEVLALRAGGGGGGAGAGLGALGFTGRVPLLAHQGETGAPGLDGLGDPPASPTGVTSRLVHDAEGLAMDACSSYDFSPQQDDPSRRSPLPPRATPTVGTRKPSSQKPQPQQRSGAPAAAAAAAGRPAAKDMQIGGGGDGSQLPEPGLVDTAAIMMQIARTQVKDIQKQLGTRLQEVQDASTAAANALPGKPSSGIISAHGMLSAEAEEANRLADAALIQEMLRVTKKPPSRNSAVAVATLGVGAAAVGRRGVPVPAVKSAQQQSSVSLSATGVLVVGSPTNTSDPDLERVRVDGGAGGTKAVGGAGRPASTDPPGAATKQTQLATPATAKLAPLVASSAAPSAAQQQQPGRAAASSSTDSAAKRTLALQPDAHRKDPPPTRSPAVDADGIVDDHRPSDSDVSPTRGFMPVMRPAGIGGDASATDDEVLGSLMLTATAAEQVLLNAMMSCRQHRANAATPAATASSAAGNTSTGGGAQRGRPLASPLSGGARPDLVRMPQQQAQSLTNPSVRGEYRPDTFVKLKTDLHPNSNDGHPPYQRGSHLLMLQQRLATPTGGAASPSTALVMYQQQPTTTGELLPPTTSAGPGAASDPFTALVVPHTGVAGPSGMTSAAMAAAGPQTPSQQVLDVHVQDWVIDSAPVAALLATSGGNAFLPAPLPRALVQRMRGSPVPHPWSASSAASSVDRKDAAVAAAGSSAAATAAARKVTGATMQHFSSVHGRLPSRVPPVHAVTAAAAAASSQHPNHLPKLGTPIAASTAPAGVAAYQVDPVVKQRIDSRTSSTAQAAPQFSYVE